MKTITKAQYLYLKSKKNAYLSKDETVTIEDEEYEDLIQYSNKQITPIDDGNDEPQEIYAITFKDGDEIVRRITGPMDTYVSVPYVEKEGYKFIGWSLDGEKITMPVDGIYDSDITYIAVWEKIEQEDTDYDYTEYDFEINGIGYKIDITNKKASISWLNPNIYENSNFIMPEIVTYKDIQFDIDSFYVENCNIQSLTFNSLINEQYSFPVNITYFYVNENNPYITAIDSIIYNKTMSRLIYFPANKNIEEFRIPNSVTEISNDCFRANKYLKRIIFNDNIEELPEYFASGWRYSSRCEYLKLSNKIKIIYGRTLYDANSLKEIILPSELEEIRKDCDWNYYALPTSLTKITISNSKIINYKFIIYTPPRYNTNGDLINEKYEISNLYVFGRFSNLKHLIVNDVNPIELDSNVFNDNQYFLINLYVPKGCKEIYENTKGWNKFYNIIELDE